MSAARQSSRFTLTRAGRQAGADGGGSARRPTAVAVLGVAKAKADAKEEVSVGAKEEVQRPRVWPAPPLTRHAHADC